MKKKINLQVKPKEKKKTKETKRNAFDYQTQTIDPDFCRWAFGVGADAPVFFSGVELVDAWNLLHKQVLELSPDGNMGEDLAMMEKIWQMEGYPSGVH